MFPWSGWMIGFNLLIILWGAVHLYSHSGGRGDTGKASREWTTDDLVACVLSALVYFNALAATALAMLGNATGWILSVAAVVEMVLMFRIIDPKLKMVSGSFEKKQQQYLEELDRIVEWE